MLLSMSAMVYVCVNVLGYLILVSLALHVFELCPCASTALRECCSPNFLSSVTGSHIVLTIYL